MPIAFNCDFSSAGTSFNLSLTASAGTAAGPTQTTSQSNCRPGLWRITYTNGMSGGGGNSEGTLQVQGSQFIIGGGGSLGWFTQTQSVASFIDDGTISGIRAPATLISAGVYESFICAGSVLQFDLNFFFTTYPGGATISAVGTWQQECQIDPSLLSS